MTERKTGLERVIDLDKARMTLAGVERALELERGIARDLDTLAAAKEAAGPFQKLLATLEAEGSDHNESLFFANLHWMDWSTVGQFREFMRAIGGKRDGGA